MISHRWHLPRGLDPLQGGLHWHFAPGLDDALCEALRLALGGQDSLLPFAGAPERGVEGRAYGLLAPSAAPIEVFVKVFRHSLPSLLWRPLDRTDPACEFVHAIRLRDIGLPVPRPLALAHERLSWGSWRSYFLMQYMAGHRSLADLLRPGAMAEGQLPALALAVAQLLVDLAARGVRHRDARPENILVAFDERDGPTAVTLIDVRHVEFASDASPEALERMLVTLAAFAFAEGADRRWATALAESAARIDREERRSLLRTSVEEIVERALAAASDLVAREVRKGRRPAASLDAFARHYGTAADAAAYRDRRFARSRHGRKVDAAERRIVGDLMRNLAVRGPVLDAPCGAGRFLPMLAAGGRDVVGADAAPEMIDLARREMAGRGLACSFVVADARRLPVPSGAFELVLSMRLMHRIPGSAERTAVLKELARCGRRWVLFSFYNRRSWRGLRERLRGRYAGETCRTIAREAAEAGLRVERFIPVGLFGRQTIVLCSVQHTAR